MFSQLSEGALETLVSLTNQLQPWWVPIKMAGYFLGFVLVGIALVDFGTQEMSMMRRKLAIGKPLVGAITGLLLLNLIPFMDMLSQTTFGSDSAKALSYGVSQGDSPQRVMLYFSITITMLVGLAGVIRGIYMVKHSGEDPRQFWPAIAHIFGGLFAVNIILFFEMLGASFGGTIGSTINRLVQ